MRPFIALLILLSSCTLYSQSSKPLSVNHYNLDKGLAIKGFDPVSYFSESKAKKGSFKFTSKHNGVTYQFSTEENKKIFEANPYKYEPQYGGWCAFAMGDNGKKVEINPETFKITDGKLYLFYNAYFTNTLKSWNKDEKGLKEKADKNWQVLIK
ncbi:MAG: YHS domain protein [Hydrotalea sp.]|nr:YHS domain protein [Hydrotalea sp.]